MWSPSPDERGESNCRDPYSSLYLLKDSCCTPQGPEGLSGIGAPSYGSEGSRGLRHRHRRSPRRRGGTQVHARPDRQSDQRPAPLPLGGRRPAVRRGGRRGPLLGDLQAGPGPAALVADGIAECQVRWPNIPIVFARPAAWPRNGPTATWPPPTLGLTEPAAVERIGEQSTLRPVPEHQTGPSPAEIRDWARQNSIHVPTAAKSQPPSAKPGNARQPRLTPDITAPDVLGWLPLSPGKITRVTAHWGRSRPPRASVVGSCAGPGELLANWRAITAGQPGCWSSRQVVFVSVWGGNGVRFLPAGRRRVG